MVWLYMTYMCEYNVLCGKLVVTSFHVRQLSGQLFHLHPGLVTLSFLNITPVDLRKNKVSTGWIKIIYKEM